MQGIESLDNFKNFVSSIGGLGRYEDTYIVHAAEGETVVPMEVLDKNPALKKRLFKTMMDMGIEPGRYIVGNELNSKNPVTGQPEFFLKKIVSQIRKALPGDSEKFLGTAVGLATGNPFLGALAGGIGSGAQGALAGGLTGFQSPGIAGLAGRRGATDLFGRAKTGALDLGNLFKSGGSDEILRFLRGTAGEEGAGLLGAGGKYTYEAVGNMCLQHGFSKCLNIVSEVLLTAMGLKEQADENQKLPLESNENEKESK